MRPPRARVSASILPPAHRWEDAVRCVTDALATGLVATPAADAVPADDLALAAELHGVEGWVRRVVGPGNPGLDRAVHAVLGRHQRALGDLALAAGALDGAVPFLVVKGPALVATCYESPDLRSYVDLDVLVRPGDLGTAVRLLEAAQFTVIDVNWPMLTRARVHELRLISPMGGAVDLHWALAGGAIADDSPPVDVLLDRSVRIDLGGVTVSTLGSADTVIHLAVHAAGAGGHRLIWLTDLRGALERARRDSPPGSMLRVVDEWQARPALALMLARAERLLGLERPPELDDLLRPGPWTAAVWLADRLAPPQLAGTSGSVSRLVARSCGATPGDSLRAAVRKSAEWWRGGRRGPLTPDELLNPEDPDSSLHPAGGPGAAEAFYAHVAATHGRRPRG